MPLTRLDILAAKYKEIGQNRNNGLFSFPDDDHKDIENLDIEHHNWNVLSEEFDDIETALNSDELFTDSLIETDESSLSQINDCLKRMRTGDVSKFNHLPAFLREYYGRKSLIEVFGDNEEFPPLDDNIKARLSEMTNHPAFRYAINTLIERKAVDRNGNSLTERLEE